MDEKNAVDVVMAEIGRYGSLKVSFDKEINFEKEKEKAVRKNDPFFQRQNVHCNKSNDEVRSCQPLQKNDGQGDRVKLTHGMKGAQVGHLTQ